MKFGLSSTLDGMENTRRAWEERGKQGDVRAVYSLNLLS